MNSVKQLIGDLQLTRSDLVRIRAGLSGMREKVAAHTDLTPDIELCNTAIKRLEKQIHEFSELDSVASGWEPTDTGEER